MFLISLFLIYCSNS